VLQLHVEKVRKGLPRELEAQAAFKSYSDKILAEKFSYVLLQLTS
jgi:hypothetical protein